MAAILSFCILSQGAISIGTQFSVGNGGRTVSHQNSIIASDELSFSDSATGSPKDAWLKDDTSIIGHGYLDFSEGFSGSNTFDAKYDTQTHLKGEDADFKVEKSGNFVTEGFTGDQELKVDGKNVEISQSITTNGFTSENEDSLSSGSIDYSGSISASPNAISMDTAGATQPNPTLPGGPVDIGKRISVNNGLVILKTTNEGGFLVSEKADITGDEAFSWHVKGFGLTEMFIAAINQKGYYASIYAKSTSGTLEAWPKVWMFKDRVKIEG